MTAPTHLAHFLDGRPICWDEHESGDADRTRYPSKVTCEPCRAELARSAGMGDAEQTVRVVLEALLATGHKIVPVDEVRAETCTDCGRGGFMLHDLDGHPWCVHHGPFGPDTEPGDCCPHTDPDEDTVRADERERLACAAAERGDIGKPGHVEVWDWLRSESAATATPRAYRKDGTR